MNENEFSINKCTEFLDHNRNGKIKSIDSVELQNSILLRVKIDDEANFQDALEIFFEKEKIKKFFSLAIKDCLLESRKRCWNKDQLLDFIDEIKIPQYALSKEEDASNIEKLIDAFEEKLVQLGSKNNSIKSISLNELETEIEKLSKLIDEKVFGIYGLSDLDKQLVHKCFGKM